MSEENVEAVRASNQAWNSRNTEAFRESLDPDVIVQTVKNWPEPGPYVGRDEALEAAGLRE